MTDKEKFWDKHAAGYAKSPVKDEASYQKKLKITQEYFRPDWRVLEFGCGTGSTAIVHAPHVEHILATDVSGKMLQIAEDKARTAGIKNIRFERGTLESLTLEEGSFDAVLGLNILHLLEDVDAAIGRVYQLLKPDGIFVSSSGLLRELAWYWRAGIKVAQCVGLAPYLARFDKTDLIDMLVKSGFVIDCEWQPAKLAVFIVAKKPA